VVQPCAAQVAVLLLSVTVVLPCAVQAVMLRLAVTITVARITVADGGMVPVPSLLVWQSVPPLVPQQLPHIIIIMAVTRRITVRHLTRRSYPKQGRCRSPRGTSSFKAQAATLFPHRRDIKTQT